MENWLQEILNENANNETEGWIQELPAYQAMVSIGATDTSSPTIAKRNNVRFQHPLLGEWKDIWKPSSKYTPSTLTVYAGGPVRLQTSATPRIAVKAGVFGTSGNPTQGMEERLDWAWRYLIKLWLRDSAGVSKRSVQNTLTTGTLDEVVNQILEVDELKKPFLDWALKTFDPEYIKNNPSFADEVGGKDNLDMYSTLGSVGL